MLGRNCKKELKESPYILYHGESKKFKVVCGILLDQLINFRMILIKICLDNFKKSALITFKNND